METTAMESQVLQMEELEEQKVLSIIQEYKEIKGGLIPVLHKVQGIYGFLPERSLKLVSRGLRIPLSEIYGVASFYHFFNLEKKGQNIIRVCMGTACYVKGGQILLNRLQQELKIGVNQTTEDDKFTLEDTRCLGACGLAPVITINDKVYGKVSVEDIPRILNEYIQEGEQDEK